VHADAGPALMNVNAIDVPRTVIARNIRALLRTVCLHQGFAEFARYEQIARRGKARCAVTATAR
jgi:hypothetical protein